MIYLENSSNLLNILFNLYILSFLLFITLQDQGFGLLMGKLQAALDADAFTNDAVVKYVDCFLLLFLQQVCFCFCVEIMLVVSGTERLM